MFDNQTTKWKIPMEDVSKLTREEIEERIRELEHQYAEFFGDNIDIKELHRIRNGILLLQRELLRRE